MLENNLHAFDQAGKVAIEDGFILVDGPDGVAISLTPAAARTFGERLIAAANQVVAAEDTSR